jgi:hypothetical protein
MAGKNRQRLIFSRDEMKYFQSNSGTLAINTDLPVKETGIS